MTSAEITVLLLLDLRAQIQRSMYVETQAVIMCAYALEYMNPLALGVTALTTEYRALTGGV
ncbi:MAG: hypothetical protein J6Q89_08985 [Clostridia bacterium]|nr:hypothetical protein [Clostridia bacterium]